MPDKVEIRRIALQARRALSEDERRIKSRRICETVLSLAEYRTAQAVMVYLDFRDEVETTELAGRILQAGKRLLIPLCKQARTSLIACEIFNLSDDLHSGLWGIREPHPEKIRPVSPKNIDLAIVPGASFDNQGNRIGFGKGYYDRFLPELRKGVPVIGLAFSCQLTDEIEAEDHDYKMSLLVTENGVTYHT